MTILSASIVHGVVNFLPSAKKVRSIVIVIPVNESAIPYEPSCPSVSCPVGLNVGRSSIGWSVGRSVKIS